MPLPTIESIKTTIENNYSTNIHDPKLKGYKPIPGLLGPMFYSGGFGVVFPLLNSSGHKYAFRVWHKEIHGIKDRTNKIAQYLKKQNLPYFVEFDYVQGGLTVKEEDGEQTVDTVRMDWVEGENLHDFISKSKSNDSQQEFKRKMRELAENFKKMFTDLHRNKISHGDLQHGNVVINEDLSIKLVDYDSVYVPTFNGELHVTDGLSGYRHPSRRTSNTQAREYDDYFSELIIYSGLLALSLQPELWPDDEEEIDNFSFLFTEKDFDSIIRDTKGDKNNLDSISCPLFKRLYERDFSDAEDHKVNSELKSLLKLLVENLNETDLSSIKPIPGKKTRNHPKYGNQDTNETEIDEGIKSLADTSKSNTYGTTEGNVKIIKTDKKSLKEKYRNQ